MMGKTSAERMAETRERRRLKDIVQVQVYVHKMRMGEIRAKAALMQTQRTKDGYVEVTIAVHNSRMPELEALREQLLGPTAEWNARYEELAAMLKNARDKRG